ncbi:hypothetical protein LCGC14_0883830 [marine sediment metagenome]|uniref:Uncharacterized protein n=1 Tax=marine sediment metagenome TaxID=412755 RepID=A0A0F9P156_9ZZZZ
MIDRTEAMSQLWEYSRGNTDNQNLGFIDLCLDYIVILQDCIDELELRAKMKETT